MDSRTCTPRAPPSAVFVVSRWVSPFVCGQCPVIPRYSRGADDAATSAPTADRRDAPTSSNSAPLPSANQFSASLRDVVRSCVGWASIDGSVRSSTLRTRGQSFSGGGFESSPRSHSVLAPRAVSGSSRGSLFRLAANMCESSPRSHLILSSSLDYSSTALSAVARLGSLVAPVLASDMSSRAI